jgi:hypothetical protein
VPARGFSLALAAVCAASAALAAPAEVPKVGVNLGYRTYWGGERLMANLIMNPGLEPVEERSSLSLARSGEEWIDPWPGHASLESDWTGAFAEILTGPAAGQRRRIRSVRRTSTGGVGIAFEDSRDLGNAFLAAVSAVRYEENDVYWSVLPERGRGSCDRVRRRPESPGACSLRVSGEGGVRAGLRYRLDSSRSRGGPFYALRGRWRFSIWLRTDKAAKLEWRVHRGGGTVAAREVEAGPAWRRVDIEFEGEKEPLRDGALFVDLLSREAGVAVWFDDAALHAAEEAGGDGFSEETARRLMALSPGHLRDWQEQLGDSLSNRMAPPFARRPSRYPRRGTPRTVFSYSLKEFLGLCARIGADPWITVPPTWASRDWEALGRYLRHSGFERRLLVEFGNENWNAVFRGGAVDTGDFPEAASRAFAALRRGAGRGSPLTTIVSGQFADPRGARMDAERVRGADAVAVAPYYGYGAAKASDRAALARALHDTGPESARWRALGPRGRPERLVAEINAGSLRSGASSDALAAAYAGAVSGSALAKHLINGIEKGVRVQTVFTLAGFDQPRVDGAGRAPLWGLLPAVDASRSFRPTGLALAMLNRLLPAVPGPRVEGEGHFAIPLDGKDGPGWIAVSSSEKARIVRLSGFSPGGEVAIERLAGDSPFDTNEKSAKVRITRTTRTADSSGAVEVSISPYGLVTAASGASGGDFRFAEGLQNPALPTENASPIGSFPNGGYPVDTGG